MNALNDIKRNVSQSFNQLDFISYLARANFKSAFSLILKVKVPFWRILGYLPSVQTKLGQ